MAKASLLFILGLLSLSVITNASHHHLAHHRAHTHAANTYRHYTGDFNGDRAIDFIRQKAGGWAGEPAELFLSNGRGVFKKSTLPSNFDLNGDLTNLYIGDFNGDGKDDILRQEKGGWVSDRVNTAYLLLATGDGNFQRIVLNEDFDLNGELTNLYIGDFNGDGKDDVLRQEKGAWVANDRVNTAYLLLSKGNDFNKIVLNEDFDLNGDLTNLFVGDFNGDGKDDVLRQEKGAWVASDRVNTAYLLISKGNDFNKIVLNEDFDLNGDLTVLKIGDFNGDGLADVLRRETGGWATDRVNTAYLLISKGNDFNKIVLDEAFDFPASRTNAYIGDFNNDGKADVLRQEKGDWAQDNINTAQILFSTGSSFRTVTLPDDKEMNGDIGTLYLGDFNGDKTLDFLQLWNTDTYYVHYNQGDGTSFF